MFDTAALGPQYPDSFLDIVGEAAATDLGLLGDDPVVASLAYRTRASLYNQAPALTLDFSAGGELAPPLEPATDDQATRNQITVERREGGEHRELDQGSIGQLGRYDTQVTLNVAGDGFLSNQAGWRLHLGTSDAERFPRVSVDLDAAPSLSAAVAAIRPGDRLDLANLPATLAADGDVSLMVLGWSETIESHHRVLTLNCAPYDPWQVAVADTDRADSGGTTLNEALDTTETGVDVAIATGHPLWTTTGVPFDINIGGERMTVTAVTGASSPQTFTVTRSVNGVTKTHSSGTSVRLWKPATLAL